MALAVEHGSSRTGRWLRDNRIRIALWAAVAEGVLVLFGVVPRWPAFFVALAAGAACVLARRSLRSEVARQVAWIAAVSQLAILALPFLVAFLTLAAIVVLVILGVAALAVLFLRRR